jgi:hypothetical protein
MGFIFNVGGLVFCLFMLKSNLTIYENGQEAILKRLDKHGERLHDVEIQLAAVSANHSKV